MICFLAESWPLLVLGAHTTGDEQRGEDSPLLYAIFRPVRCLISLEYLQIWECGEWTYLQKDTLPQLSLAAAPALGLLQKHHPLAARFQGLLLLVSQD